MSAVSRKKAYAEILEKAWVGLGIVDRPVIDDINIFQASLRAMVLAVSKLKKMPDCVLIDGPHKTELPFMQIPVVDGDAKSFSIACASVVAKVTRDEMMEYYDQVYPEYGFKKHKGYGTADHMAALQKFGPCDIHRKSFEPVRKLLVGGAY